MTWVLMLHFIAHGLVVRVTSFSPDVTYPNQQACQAALIKMLPQITQNPPKGQVIVPVCQAQGAKTALKAQPIMGAPPASTFKAVPPVLMPKSK